MYLKYFCQNQSFFYKLKGFSAKNTTFASLGKFFQRFIVAVMPECAQYSRITFLPLARSTQVSF